MATPNYSYEKRQRELAKKRKQEDKRRAKLDPKSATPEHPEPGSAPGSDPSQPATDPTADPGPA